MEETHQQGHDEPVQVDHLDAAHIQLHSAITFGRVSISGPLRGTGRKTHGEAEHLIAYNGDGLGGQK